MVSQDVGSDPKVLQDNWLTPLQMSSQARLSLVLLTNGCKSSAPFFGSVNLLEQLTELRNILLKNI